MKKILLSILVIVVMVSLIPAENVSAKPGKKGVSGAAQINGTTYKWVETSWRMNRGMTFNPGNIVYQMKPNPHDDPWYNKNQEKFYNQAAAAIKKLGDAQGWTPTTWPRTISGVIVNGVTYYLEER